MKRLRNGNGNTIYIYKEISFITILHVTTRRQSIAKPPMEDSYGRLHMNIDVREIKQVVNILHIYHAVKEQNMKLYISKLNKTKQPFSSRCYFGLNNCICWRQFEEPQGKLLKWNSFISLLHCQFVSCCAALNSAHYRAYSLKHELQ